MTYQKALEEALTFFAHENNELKKMNDKAELKFKKFHFEQDLCNFVNENNIRIKKIETVDVGATLVFYLWY